EACPTDITVFLIEVAEMELGGELSAPVVAAMERVIGIVETEFLAPLRPAAPERVSVEITGDGYLRMAAVLAA
ncbi:MAG: peptidase M52, partial [Mycobacterium sp.]|nr:peptidase M52 [Mycobacterium sp.]